MNSPFTFEAETFAYTSGAASHGLATAKGSAGTAPTDCPTPAPTTIPAYLEPNLLACVSAVVPTQRVKWMLAANLREQLPNWVHRLQPKMDLSKPIPTVKVTIELFRFIPIHFADIRLLKPLNAYLHAKGINYYSLVTANLKGRPTIENRLGISLAGLYQKAGITQTIPLDEFHRYVVVVYASFPTNVSQYLRATGNYALNKFEFGKASLRDFHIASIATIAYDTVVSRWTSKVVTGIHIRGHTDDRGTDGYNYALGLQRATNVKQQLKNAILRITRPQMLEGVKKINFSVASLSKDEPISKTDRALNRRVEVTFDYTSVAQVQLLQMGETASRAAKLLQNQRTLDKDAAQRLLCVMGKMQNVSIDDRFVTNALAVEATNRLDPRNWSRIRYDLVEPRLFGQQVSDKQILKNLEMIDGRIIEGVSTLNRVIHQREGAVQKATEALLSWVEKQLSNANSVYACYKTLLKP